jgi:predicted regulator of Ras-like GTPase activity (Roadblock/LC7/MglB family)
MWESDPVGSLLPPPDGDRQEVLKNAFERADTDPVSAPTVDPTDAGPVIASDVTASMHQLLDHVVGHVPGVVGAVVGSADGFSLAARLPATSAMDAASLAAMSAALLGLANRLVQSIAPAPSRVAELRSDGAHGYVFAVAHAATLTVLTTPEADRPQILAVGHEVTNGLLRLLRGIADV